MPVDQAERFEAVAGDLLDELDYERAFPRPRADLLRHAADFRDRVTTQLRAQGQPVPGAW